MSEFAIGEHVRIGSGDGIMSRHYGRTGMIVEECSVGNLAHDPRYIVRFDDGFGRDWVRGSHLERVEPRLVPVLTPTPATRVVHVKLDPYDVYIGRTMAGTKYVNQGWGNRYRVLRGESPAAAISNYREWILTQPEILARLPELRGKTLGCWCAPKGGIGGDIHGVTCHGEILAALADDPDLLARLRAETERSNSQFVAFLSHLAQGTCPHCGTPVKREKQVGRCVYAEPCGHRLYQGKTRERVEQERKECELAQHAAAFEAHHVHTWHYWAADARYQRCSSCGKARYVGSEVAQ